MQPAPPLRDTDTKFAYLHSRDVTQPMIDFSIQTVADRRFSAATELAACRRGESMATV